MKISLLILFPFVLQFSSALVVPDGGLLARAEPGYGTVNEIGYRRGLDY